MSVTVMIPSAMRQYADGEDTIELAADSVSNVLATLTDTHPQLKTHLLNDDGSLRNFVNVFVNDENIRDMQQDRTPVKDGDEVLIVPAVAGG